MRDKKKQAARRFLRRNWYKIARYKLGDNASPSFKRYYWGCLRTLGDLRFRKFN